MHLRDKPLTYSGLESGVYVHGAQGAVIDWNKVFKGAHTRTPHPRVCTEAVIWKVPRLYGKEINFLILKGPSGIVSRNGDWLAKASDLKTNKQTNNIFPSPTAIFSLQMTGTSFLSPLPCSSSHCLPKDFFFFTFQLSTQFALVDCESLQY